MNLSRFVSNPAITKQRQIKHTGPSSATVYIVSGVDGDNEWMVCAHRNYLNAEKHKNKLNDEVDKAMVGFERSGRNSFYWTTTDNRGIKLAVVHDKSFPRPPTGRVAYFITSVRLED